MFPVRSAAMSTKVHMIVTLTLYGDAQKLN